MIASFYDTPLYALIICHFLIDIEYIIAAIAAFSLAFSRHFAIAAMCHITMH